MKAKARTEIDVSAMIATGRNRYTFKAADNEANIDIFGEIDDWWGFGVRDMAYNLSQNKGKKLYINIHSPGGSVLEGVGIANLIQSHNAETTTTGVGFVASIASVILLAGDRVRMAKNAFLMIHNPWSMAMGDSEELRKTADVLDKMENQLAAIYATAMQKRGKDKDLEEVKKMMAAETWFTAQEALDAGLIDEVTDRVEIADSPEDAEMQVETLARFRNIPQALADQYNFSNTKTKKMAEKNKSLFAKLGEIFATAAAEVEAPETQEETAQLESETTDATMTVEEARKLLEREGYTVAAASTEEASTEANEADAEAEMEEIMALKAQVAELTKAVKRKVGTPSGGAASTGTKEKSDLTEEHVKAFGNLANIVRSYRPL